MQKLLTFDSFKHEFTYYATISLKAMAAIEAIDNRLRIVAERINELIDRDSSVDLEAFKVGFLRELETALTQDESISHDLDLQDRFNLLELQFESLAERVSKIESALGHEKVDL